MNNHPYRQLPDRAYWRRSVAAPNLADVDPVGQFDLQLTPQTLVATAGSCFAQHIARHLKGAGFNYYVAEPGHPILSQQVREQQGYGLFSARYGNVYTARQLRQLVERAVGMFHPSEPPWVDADGSVRDPFRPTVQPGNFISVNEMEADRRQHLSCVKMMLQKLNVFVFTLGLTEAWVSRNDGAAFPICPGINGGTFDPERYEFCNFSVAEVVADMEAAMTVLRSINAEAQVVLTVSPVPLAATATPGAHVLTATTYSKSVLRVAAQMLTETYSFVHYFPSYEIVTGSYNRGAYFAEDLRNVTEAGVNQVMRLFLAHATAEGSYADKRVHRETEAQGTDVTAVSAAFVEAECDEAELDSL